MIYESTTYNGLKLLVGVAFAVVVVTVVYLFARWRGWEAGK